MPKHIEPSSSDDSSDEEAKKPTVEMTPKKVNRSLITDDSDALAVQPQQNGSIFGSSEKKKKRSKTDSIPKEIDDQLIVANMQECGTPDCNDKVVSTPKMTKAQKRKEVILFFKLT